MCGINGIIKYNEVDLTKSIQSMNDLIYHRGPDEDGVFIDTNPDYSVGLGMRRLSIIDLQTGTQPMCNDSRDLIIVFNGEIYNYLVLKQEYLSEEVFKTHSDTEVILKLYEKFGTDSFGLLDGMYAFSIYDKKKKEIIIARDFFGEKPLYYYMDNHKLIWASELKSIISQLENKPDIDRTALSLYFSLTYIPAPYTIYQDIYKLEPNHYLTYDIEKKKIQTKKIHQKQTESSQSIAFNDAVTKTEKLVRKSVVSRSISDVPIGTFLSGGVDSSIVSLCLAQNSTNKIDTFSIGFEKKSFDESNKARTVAKLIKSNHHEFIVNENSLKEDIDEVLLNFDEPFADSSALPTYLVSKITSNYVKVALTGDGGDEVFGGYNKYRINSINNKYIKFIHPRFHELIQSVSYPLLKTNNDDRGLKFKIKKVLDAIDYDNEFYYKMISLGFKNDEIVRLLKSEESDIFDYYKNNLQLNESKTLKGMRNIDKHISLEGDMLVKVDRTSMLASLESRAPFLNKEIWDFTNTLPDSYLIKGNSKKHILKEAFKTYFPKDFLDLPKQGFGVPVGDWLRNSLKKELLSYTDKTFILKQNIFNYEYITSLVNNHISGKEDNTFKIWTFYVFQKWYINSYEHHNNSHRV